MSETTRRTIRTGFQVVLGVLAIAAVVIPTLTAFTEFGLPASWVATGAALVVAATVTVTAVQNKLEELGWLPALVKGDEYVGKHRAPETDA